MAEKDETSEHGAEQDGKMVVQKPRRKRYTADDVERALATRRDAARKMLRTPRAKFRIAIGALAVVGVATAVVFGMSATNNAAAEQKLSHEVSENQQRLDAMGGHHVTTAKVSQLVKTVQEKAQQVADIQQKFAEIRYNGQVQYDSMGGQGKDAQNGGISPSMTYEVQNRDRMAPYFAKNMFIVSDDNLHSYTTRPLFDTTEIDPRFSWFVGYDTKLNLNGGPSVLKPEQAKWQVTGIAKNQEGGYQVAWENIAPDGTVYAAAHADYDADSEVFHTLSVQQTLEGTKHSLAAAMGDDGSGDGS